MEDNVEDRVIANLSGDTNKLAVFTEGIDGHSLAASYYFKSELEELLGHPITDHKEAARELKQLVDDKNKQAKAIRQRSKPVTFGLSYGAFPAKVAESIRCSLEEAQIIFDAYHNEMYPEITEFRERVLQQASEQGYTHMGLGARLYSDDIQSDARTLFNSNSQFWSILTLIAINEIHHRIDKAGYQDNIIVTSTIYDAIYFEVRNDPTIIKWLNDNIVPIMSKDFLIGQIVHNDASLEVGRNWAEAIEIPHNASEAEITTILKELTNET